MENEKINIYVPDYVADTLDNDASMFEVVKNDGRSINRNRFLSMLILGYSDMYASECQRAFDSIVRELVDHNIDEKQSREIAHDVLIKAVLPETHSKKGKNSTRFSLKPTKETESLLLDITYNQVRNASLSQYFCRMFVSYCKKPFFEREQIVFRDNYEKLKQACGQQKTIALSMTWDRKEMHEVVPYRIMAGKEGIFNYLLCGEVNRQNGLQETRSYRLSRILHVHPSKASLKLAESVQMRLDKMAYYAPQFSINEDIETCVRLTKEGTKNYNRIYYGRPRVERIVTEGDDALYFFKCSEDQIFLYFRRFLGDTAEVLSPSSLRKRMQVSFMNNLSMYER